MNCCPYCGLEDDTDHVSEGHAPFEEGGILFCNGCGGMEIATGVLWETRTPRAADLDTCLPFVEALRREFAEAQRAGVTDYFAHRLGSRRQATDLHRGGHAP